jgi:FlaA1/EpsC-like NDP-sugar epimerase/lipopolysaccharide/colanic/teichoic acid biosynthesis glycosyltransferase
MAVVKRCLDIWAAVIALVVLAPVAAVAAAGVLLTMGRPVCFRQVRPGAHAAPFVLLKFRTMRPACGGMDEHDFGRRLTKFGRWLRKSSLDEIPQLINVLKGELSLVGPRPLLPEYLPLYNVEQARRHDVRPGITGLAQISGRSRIRMEKRFEYDVWYVDNWSLWLDLRILLRTVLYVVLRRGIAGNGAPTDQVWAGNVIADQEQGPSGGDSTSDNRDPTRVNVPATVTDKSAGTAKGVGSYPFPFTSAPWPKMLGSLAVPIVDGIAWIVALSTAAWFRYDGNLDQISVPNLAHIAIAAIVVQWVLGFALRSYRGRYYLGSVEQAGNLAVVALGVALFLFGYQLLTPSLFVPRSVPLTAPFIMLVLAGGARLMIRGATGRSAGSADVVARRVIVFGAGEAGRQLVKSMLSESRCGYLPVAMLDDDPLLRRRCVAGVQVRGNQTHLASVAFATKAELLVIAVPSADVSLTRDLTRSAMAAGLEVKHVPALSELLRPAGCSDLREVNVAELLGRGLVETDIALIAGYLRGQRVLVTGAGGSIGSELCRQIHRLEPAELMMLDHDESALHAVKLSIAGAALLDSRDVILADIRDGKAIRELFLSRGPQVVFHAAALKHLPMLEQYPTEAWKTNVLGTMNVLDAAVASGVKRFVNISTDKAVNPISVLGRSKRVGERLVAGVSDAPTQRYLSVRFGNVLGSRGSVLTTFADQIAGGRPVTVTHPNITRFFMTIPEAVELVIQAAAIGGIGEVLVLDMGLPVRIVDVAHHLMESAGRGTSIVYTGLRRGEKLHEELFGATEVDVRPVNPSISHVIVPPLSPEQLTGLSEQWDPAGAMEILAGANPWIVPPRTPADSPAWSRPDGPGDGAQHRENGPTTPGVSDDRPAMASRKSM